MRVVLALIAMALAGTAAAQSPPTVPPDAIAIVRDQPVPRVDYDRTLEQTRRSYARSNRPFPEEGTAELARLRQGIVEFLVQRAMFEVKARELGVAVSDAEVEERIAQLKRQYFGGSERKFQEQLRRQGLTIESAPEPAGRGRRAGDPDPVERLDRLSPADRQPGRPVSSSRDPWSASWRTGCMRS